MRSTTVLFVAFAFIATAFADDASTEPPIEPPSQECPENQEWSDCASACEPQCNTFPGEKCGAVMTMQCVQQCVCKTGHVRIAENECIREDDPLCEGRYDPMDAFRKHKYSGVQPVVEDLAL